MKIPVILSSMLVSACAFADTTLTYTDTNDKVSMQMKLAGNMMRADSMGDENTFMIYNASDSSFVVAMKDKKEYFKLNKEQIESMGDTAAMLDKVLEKQLAQIPESQRAMMKKMLEGQLKAQMPKPKPPADYDFTGAKETVNGYDCQVVVKTSSGKTSDFCVAEYSDLGMKSNEYDILVSFQQTVAAMAQRYTDDHSMDFSKLGDYIPVKFNQTYQSGALSDVNHENIPVSQFEIPKGFKRIDMPF